MSEPTVIAAEPERPSPTRPAPADSEIGAPPRLTERSVSRWGRWGWLALAVALLAALVVLFGFNPSHHGFYPLCVFHRLTGMQCPGCGGLRAVHHLLHGEVVTAFRFNQLVVLAWPFVVWSALRRLLRGPRAAPVSHRI